MLLASWLSVCSVRCPSCALQNHEVPPCNWDTDTLSVSQKIQTLSCSGYLCANAGSNFVTENVNSTCVALARLFLYKLVFNFIPIHKPLLSCFWEIYSDTSHLARLNLAISSSLRNLFQELHFGLFLSSSQVWDFSQNLHHCFKKYWVAVQLEFDTIRHGSLLAFQLNA